MVITICMQLIVLDCDLLLFKCEAGYGKMQCVLHEVRIYLQEARFSVTLLTGHFKNSVVITNFFITLVSIVFCF
jgi:hypothetical protein